MSGLARILYSMIATIVPGVAVVGALVMGIDTAPALLMAAAPGCVVALPAALILARRMGG